MAKLYLGLFFFLVSFQLRAQSLSVVSHYPASAYVAYRLLPFTVSGGENVEITRVEVTGADSCTALVDPFYRDIFHIYCRAQEVFDASIYIEGEFGEETILQLENMAVAIQRAPGDAFDTAIRAAGGSESAP